MPDNLNSQWISQIVEIFLWVYASIRAFPGLCKEHNTLKNFCRPYQRVCGPCLIVECLEINDHNDKPVEWSVLAFPSDCYDPSMIYSIENEKNEKLVTDPGVRLNDIAGLNDAKKPSFYLFPCPTFSEAFIDHWRGSWWWVLPELESQCWPKLSQANAESGSSMCRRRPSHPNIHHSKVLFKMAKFHALSAIFINKIDALCSQRGWQWFLTLSFALIQIQTVLIQMDGLAGNIRRDDNSLEKVVMVLAAVNFPWDIDEIFIFMTYAFFWSKTLLPGRQISLLLHVYSALCLGIRYHNRKINPGTPLCVIRRRL